MSLLAGKGIAGYVAKTGKKVNLTNAYEDSRFDPSWDHKTNYKTKTVLCVPVKDNAGAVIAVIQALNKKRQKLDFEHPNQQYWKEPDVIREEKDYILHTNKPNTKYTVSGVPIAGAAASEDMIEPFSEEDEEILDVRHFCSL